jgi:hypothetical protein
MVSPKRVQTTYASTNSSNSARSRRRTLPRWCPVLPKYTYSELNHKANQLANYLIGRAVTANCPVGICMDRSCEMVIAVLGILKAGGSYVPFDSTYPKARLALQIGPPPRKTAWISWNIEPLCEPQSELSIMVTPILDSHLLEATKTSYVQKYFGESMVVYLDSLLRGVGHFLETGKAVEQRQFGSHPVYAP